MAWFLLARLLFVIAVVYSAILLRPLGGSIALNALFGVALAATFVGFEARLKNTSVTHMLGAMLGGAIGLGIAKTVGAALFWADTKDDRVVFLHSFVLLALPYLGLVLGGRKGEWLEPARLVGLFRGTGPQRRYRILDTSVIIDGRVADICETGFLDGTLVIPQFVLKELQLVADSSDSMKRNRGRRGLDILQKIQKMSGVEVMISDLDFPEVREVDLKLIELARALSGKIVTNDFNLNKVAQLRGVAVLNINELANSLKPVVLPGEIMKVFILKEGKEFNQGVAYLDDGTMVVVDNARKLIGRTIDVVVTSVLQTTAGKMIFGRFVDPSVAAAQGPVPVERDDQQRRPRVSPTPQPQVPAPVAAVSPAPQAATAQTPAPSGVPVGNGGVERPRGWRVQISSFHWWRTVFFLIPAIGVYTIILGTLSLLSSLFDRRGHFAHGCARLWSWLILATTGVSVDLRGLEQLAPGRTYIFVSNHQSIYDIPVIFSSLPYQLRIIAKESLGSFPFLGWHLRRTGHLLVDRRNPDRSGILRRWKALVGQGLSLIIFPEGTRSQDGRVGLFKAGSFLLAIEAQLPLVPLSVDGTRRVMRKGELTTRPGHATLVVHAPIETAGLTVSDARALAQRVRAVVASATTQDVVETRLPSPAFDA